jgi:hypothetical protein
VADETKNPVGRPTLYKQEYHCETVRKLCLIGLTDKQIADFFDISQVTLDTWKREHPEFLMSIKAGKEIADAEVGAALYQRAIGYSCPDIVTASYLGEITIEKVTKHYPPDTIAGMFWLKNRQPEKFRDRHEIEHSGTISKVDELLGKVDEQMDNNGD